MFTHTRLHRRVGLFALLAAVGITSSGCWFLWDDGPAEVTRDFWNAARDGNTEMVEALSVNRHGADFDFDLDDTDSEIRSISIGDTEIDGDEAEVLTVIEGTNEDMELTVEFKTALVKQDGEWLVEVEETTGRLIGAFMGEMASYIGEALGEGLEEAMEGMADELAEGMDELGEALQEAAAEMKERSERERRDNR